MDDGYGTYAVEAGMADERTACVVQMSNLCMRERACLANDSLSMMWCFDSGATSMSMGNEKIFEFLGNQYRGTLTILSGTRVSIKDQGNVKFRLPNHFSALCLSRDSSDAIHLF